MAYRKRLLLLGDSTYGDSTYGAPSAIDADFTTGSIPSPFLFSRSSAGNAFVGGTLTSFATDVPRFTDNPCVGLLLEPTATNYIPNPRGEGIVSLGYPTGWQNIGTSVQMTWTFVGTGIENGIPYTDARLTGTYVNGTVRFAFCPITAYTLPVAGAINRACFSAFVKVVAGTIPVTMTSLNLGAQPYDGAQASLGSPSTTTITVYPLGTPLRDCRSAVATVVNNASCSYMRPIVSVQLTAGVVDMTIRIGCPQFESGSTAGNDGSGNATMPMFPPAGSPAAVTRQGDYLRVPAINTKSYYNPSAVAFLVDFQQNTYNAQLGRRSVLVALTDGTYSNCYAATHIPSLTTPGGALLISGSVYQYVSGTTNPPPAALGVLTRGITTHNDMRRNTMWNGGFGNSGYIGEVNGPKPLPAMTELTLASPAFGPNGANQSLAMEYVSHVIRRFEYYPRWMSPEEMFIASSMGPDNYPYGASLGYDFTASPSLDPSITFSRASVGTYFDSSGILQTATSGTPRFDYDPVSHAARGLLIEESRINSIKNSTMTGAAAGSPGTDPTGWTVSTVGGLTKTIVGIGTEAGISYIDYRFNAAAATAANLNFMMAPSGVSSLPASVAVYTMSMYAALKAGALPPQVSMRINSYDSGGGNLGVQAAPTMAASLVLGNTLIQGKQAYTFPSTPATTAFILPFVQIAIPAGAVDFTLRIGAPQLELGGFATSYIPTTAAAVTRNADIATTNVTPWINTAAGSLAVELMLPQVLSTGTNIAIAALDSGAATNTIEARQQGLSTQPAVSVFIANALVGGASGINNFTPSVVNKIAFNYNSAPLAITCALNGVIGAVLGTPTSLPTISRMTIGSGRNSLINGYVRKIKYWPRAVSDIELQAATT